MTKQDFSFIQPRELSKEEAPDSTASPICVVAPFASLVAEEKSIEDYEGHSLYSRHLVTALRRNWTISVVANKAKGVPAEPGVYRVWRQGFRYPFTVIKQALRTGAKVIHFERVGPTVFGPYFTVPFLPLLVLAFRLLGRSVVVSFSDVIDSSHVNSGFLRSFQSWIHTPAIVRFGLTYFYLLTGSFASLILAQTENSQTVLREKYHLAEEKLRLVPLTGPAPPKALSSEEAKRRLGLEGKKMLLFFGHVAPYKGLDSLVEAQSIVQKHREDVALVIAGGNHRRLQYNYLSHLQELSKKCDTNVRFTGYLPDELIPIVFSAADIIVYPCTSIPGSSGCVNLTKQYAKPLVTTTAVAREEGLVHMQDSYIAADPTPEILASAILTLLDDGSLTSRIGRNFARTSIPMSMVADGIGSMYKRLL